YSSLSDYRELPSEKTFVACRGPWFAPVYDRYEFRMDGSRMPVAVIVPKTPAAGKPWALRAGFVTRDAVVDLALLASGFHIVTGPIPTDTDQTPAIFESQPVRLVLPEVLTLRGAELGKPFAPAALSV